MSVEYVIVCDGCGDQLDAGRVSAAATRWLIRQRGGRVALPGGRDLCPECVADGKRVDRMPIAT